MKKTAPFIFLAAFLMILPSAFAGIDNFSLDFTISTSKVYVVQEIMFADANEFRIEIPADATEVSLSVDRKLHEINESELTVRGREIMLSYLTRQFIDKKNFVMELSYPDDISSLAITLHVPSNLELTRPVEQKTLASNAIFPKATSITTDGQRIKIAWERKNASKGDSLSVLVMLKERVDYIFLVYIIIAVVIAAVIFILVRKPKIKTIVKTRTARIEQHLKEDEEQIVRILKSRQNQCEQGTLRVVTGFSKAKLSGLLKELEDRKIIYKEKRGKKNIVFLK